ncbi:sterol desaturase family protein [Flavobacteriaceae bacterium]|nr:sterol desaturase family protein [Flavobacteriaceae bacterium]MDA9843709.1 sterol desaturase family protein [Flavobacteriaceae bacterium]
METIIAYFETIPSLHRSLILIGGLTFFWILEGSFSLFNFQYKKWKHALPNVFFTLTTVVINFVLAFLLLNTSDWTVKNEFGILFWLTDLPLWADAILGLLLMDLIGAYLPHWTEHRVKPLWMIHLVHHSDHYVDTTTANRHHPLESLVRFGFTLFGVFIIGANMGIVMLYQSLSLISTQFNHANIKLPKKIDLYLSYFLVSPDMHKTHHHYRLPYTDSNFGNIFSIWDRLFGTYLSFDREKLVYGVDVFYDKEANGKISTLIKQPFQPYSKPTLSPESEI